MKLYTEEQLQVAYDIGNMDGRLNNIDYSITDRFKPIELPTDEEIYLMSEAQSEHSLYNMGFKYGAKWMRDKILNK